MPASADGTPRLQTTVRIIATLEHAAESGDGVRGRIVSSRSGLLGEWSIHHGSVENQRRQREGSGR